MLFTDMEGSTRLLSRLGDQYGELLSGQRGVLRAAFSRYHGTEMGTEGDSFAGTGSDCQQACCQRSKSSTLGGGFERLCQLSGRLLVCSTRRCFLQSFCLHNLCKLIDRRDILRSPA